MRVHRAVPALALVAVLAGGCDDTAQGIRDDAEDIDVDVDNDEGGDG